MAKLLNNVGTARFSRVATTATAYDDDTIEGLTDVDVKQSFLVSRSAISNDSAIVIEAVITNKEPDKELKEGYDLQGVALYAEDPEVGEILYSVTPTSHSAYIPPFNGSTSTEILIKVFTIVGNSAQIDLTIDPSAALTQADYERFAKYTDDKFDKVGGMIADAIGEIRFPEGHDYAPDIEAALKQANAYTDKQTKSKLDQDQVDARIDTALTEYSKSWYGTLSEYQALGQYENDRDYYIVANFEVVI
ncbi:hypothetical protein [Lacticaseibacillus saniviri]|nr:hypothetical protein [Lacticaseibacillus saniviri]